LYKCGQLANLVNLDIRQWRKFQQVTTGVQRAFPIATESNLTEKNTMLRIQRSGNGEVVFTLSGRMDEDDIAELETLIRLEPDRHRIVLDLRNLTLAGQDAISFLERWETEGITLKNCAAYVREWITRSRDRS
jgi:hypothetical protein